MLKNVRPYHGSGHFHVANRNSLPITTVGDITPIFSNAFILPGLSDNLLLVSQLLDNNYDIHFSRDGCCVQDRVSRTLIAKGPKVGRLFPLHISIPSNASLTCSAVVNKSEVWHKRLGHPNSTILSSLLASCLLGKDQFSSLSFDCSTCKLGKSNILPFPLASSHAIKCFDIIHSDVRGITLVISHAHFEYFVAFIDDYSLFSWICFLRSNLRSFKS